MWGEREKCPGLVEEAFGVARVAWHRAHLEGYVALMTPIRGAHDRSLATAADDGDYFIAAMQQARQLLSHSIRLTADLPM
jgi:hypothetical protein